MTNSKWSIYIDYNFSELTFLPLPFIHKHYKIAFVFNLSESQICEFFLLRVDKEAIAF